MAAGAHTSHHRVGRQPLSFKHYLTLSVMFIVGVWWGRETYKTRFFHVSWIIVCNYNTWSFKRYDLRSTTHCRIDKIRQERNKSLCLLTDCNRYAVSIFKLNGPDTVCLNECFAQLGTEIAQNKWSCTTVYSLKHLSTQNLSTDNWRPASPQTQCGIWHSFTLHHLTHFQQLSSNTTNTGWLAN